MPKFRIVVEITSVNLLSKEFEAPDMDDAKRQAEAEAWEGPNASGWEDFDSTTSAEIREDQCKEITDNENPQATS